MNVTLVNHKRMEHPKLNLTVRRVEASTFYTLGFHKHHYMAEKINPACKCFLFEWDNNPVAFIGVINSPGNNRQYSMAFSRIVILPEYQGLGLLKRLVRFVSGIIKSTSTEEKPVDVYIRTIHPKVGAYLNKDTDNWESTSSDMKKTSKDNELGKYNNRKGRVSYSKRYIGESIYGYEDLLLPVKEMRKRKS